MIRFHSTFGRRWCVVALIFVIASGDFAPVNRVAAQTASDANARLAHATPDARAQPLRLERTSVAGGAELLTIFGVLAHTVGADETGDVPLVSVLRDTLGDSDPTNDRLRDVWMHTYTRPSLRQRLLAAVPFLYTNRLGGAGNGDKVPPSVIDLSKADADVWNRFFWLALQSLFLDPQGILVKAPTETYRRNVTDYRKAHLIRALAVLSLYELSRRERAADSGTRERAAPPALSDIELAEIGGRLALAERTFGGIIDDINLQRVYAKQAAVSNDALGHNWELLRQQAERNNLYFEPLALPDGTATHAVLWVAAEDLPLHTHKAWHGRFLNIANPWRDRRLQDWRGHTEMWNFDQDGARISNDGANNIATENVGIGAIDKAIADKSPSVSTRHMIPLALYGLDHPKIPVLLVDFRDRFNPKKREMSKRVIQDVTRNVLAVGRFGNLYYSLGRTIFDFVAGRRGMDINQPTRLRTYSQLKLLLALDASLDPEFRDEISARSERVALNPMENSVARETELARRQHAALLAYARDPRGLSARLARDRREEMTRFTSTGTTRVLTSVAHVATFGAYTHRARSTPERLARLEQERQLNYHTRFLREVARSSPVVEVRWNIDDVRRSLEFVARRGALADARAAHAVARIFVQTEDESARELSLRCLYRINLPAAKTALLRIESDAALSTRWRAMSRDLLRTAVREEQRFAQKDLPRAQNLL